MSENYAQALERLSRVTGVQGALLVDAQAGVPVVEEVANGVSGSALAALAASIYRRTKRSTETAGFGALETLQIEAGGGHVIIAGAGDVLVVAVAQGDAQLGLVRLETRRAAEGLRS